MSHIDKLIVELVPDGVTYYALGDVATFHRGTSMTKEVTTEGTIPVIAGGRMPAYLHGESNRSGETIVVAGSGAYAGFVTFWTEPVFVSDAFTVHPNPSLLAPKYVYHFLLARQEAIHAKKSAGGVPHVKGSDLALFRIPVPPLEIQQEIVKVLDLFKALEADLEAELEARKRQYAHYRDSLVSPRGTSVRWIPLGEIASVRVGQAPRAEILANAGAYAYVNAGTTESGRSIEANTPGDTVTIPSRGQGGVGIVGYQADAFWCGPLCYRITSLDADLSTRFLYHYLKNVQPSIRGLQQTGGTPALNRKELVLVKVAVPSIEEQERVVAILDKFDALVNDLGVGLPAELAARRKQYEYYRDQLLTFEKKVT